MNIIPEDITYKNYSTDFIKTLFSFYPIKDNDDL